MKKLFFSLLLTITSFLGANAQTWTPVITYRNNSSSSVNTSSRYQRSYTRKDGTFVSGHMKTRRNNTNHDNYSTSRNVNPFTGTIGSRARDYSVRSYNYGSGHVIHTGSRGGQYYINSNGNKTYVPKRRR